MDFQLFGIIVEFIIFIDGKYYFNEVYFENVSVFVVNCIGEEGKGWMYVNYLFGYE